MVKRKNKILRVGFDLDGVLLYNPARIARPIIVFLKKIFLPKEQNKFHLPKTKLQKFIWSLLHKTSFTSAGGIEIIKKMIIDKKIKAFIISARYESLKSDFDAWINIIEAKKYFTGIYHNNNNEQPHLFKEQMIIKLNLDIFVEDNWDIVKHLSKKTNTKIFWIYNLLDRNINYEYKFPNLKETLKIIKKKIS